MKIIILALLFTLSLAAQDFDQQEVIRVESRLVLIPVSVLDSKGNPVEGLTIEDFIVKEEGRLQKIDSVLIAEQMPLEIAILFDISASTESLYEFQKDALIRFLEEVMRFEDNASIFLIGEKPQLIQPRAKLNEVISSVEKIKPSKQYTALYDTIVAATEYLKHSAPQSRRVILAITDGEDTNSQSVARAIQDGYRRLGKQIDMLDSKSLYEFTVKVRDEAVRKELSRILKLLQDADVVFYSINLSSSSYRLNKISRSGHEILEKLAEETGGTAYLSDFRSTSLKDPYQNEMNARLNKESLDKIFRHLSAELRRQYLIAYYSESSFSEGKFVSLSVELNRAGNFQIRARRGYFVHSK